MNYCIGKLSQDLYSKNGNLEESYNQAKGYMTLILFSFEFLILFCFLTSNLCERKGVPEIQEGGSTSRLKRFLFISLAMLGGLNPIRLSYANASS